MRRIDAVCSLIVPADTIADVACDHGKVAEYCAVNRLCECVIASDISEECLDKARRRLSGADNVRFVKCDGIKYDCDEAIIAGIGGLLTVKILEEATAMPNTLVLCPHRNVDGVRMFLTERGYRIEKDFMCVERGKFYSVMRAVRSSEPQMLDRSQILFGVYYAEDCDLVSEYIDRLYTTYMRAPKQNADILAAIAEAKQKITNRQ